MLPTELVGKNVFRHGFTLIELLVSLSIMAMIMGITLSGGPQTIMRLSLADNTYKAELLLREAQLQGSAINSLNNTFGGVGIFIDTATSTDVVKFKDQVDPSIERAIGIGNGLYDMSPVNEKDVTISTTNNHKISKVCVASGTSPFICNAESSPTVNTLTISFTRPKQTAQIYINGTSSVNYTSACIEFASMRAPEPGYVRSILVYRSGMITKRLGACN